MKAFRDHLSKDIVAGHRSPGDWQLTWSKGCHMTLNTETKQKCILSSSYKPRGIEIHETGAATAQCLSWFYCVKLQQLVWVTCRVLTASRLVPRRSREGKAPTTRGEIVMSTMNQAGHTRPSYSKSGCSWALKPQNYWRSDWQPIAAKRERKQSLSFGDMAVGRLLGPQWVPIDRCANWQHQLDLRG